MKKTNQTPETKATEVKAAEKQPVEKSTPKVDRKALVEAVKEAFKDNKTIDVVADTDFSDEKTGIMRATAQPEYRYVHIFKKDTTKNCMQWYIHPKNSIFVIGKGMIDVLPDSDIYEKHLHRKGYWEIITNHENTEKTLTSLVSAYEKLQTNKAAEAEKAAKAKAEKQAEEKKAKAEKKAEKKVTKEKKEA